MEKSPALPARLTAHCNARVSILAGGGWRAVNENVRNTRLRTRRAQSAAPQKGAPGEMLERGAGQAHSASRFGSEAVTYAPPRRYDNRGGMRNLRRFRAASPPSSASPPSRRGRRDSHVVLERWSSPTTDRPLLRKPSISPSPSAQEDEAHRAGVRARAEAVLLWAPVPRGRLSRRRTGASDAALQQLAVAGAEQGPRALAEGHVAGRPAAEMRRGRGLRPYRHRAAAARAAPKGYLGSVSYAVVQGSPVAVLIAKDARGAGAAGGAMAAAADAPGAGESAATTPAAEGPGARAPRART